MIRLYGTQGNGSHSRVTDGFRTALEEAGLLEGFIGLFGTEDPEGPPGGAQAPIGVFTGPLGAVWRMHFNAKHERRYAMVAPNSSEIGARLELLLQENVTHLLAPSKWAADVLRQKLSLPVEVVPHGVHEDFAPYELWHKRADAAYAAGGFEALHLSSSDRQRKGTEELIQGWHLAKWNKTLPPDARLCLVLEQGQLMTLGMKYKKEIQDSRIVMVGRLGVSREGLPTRLMSELYQQFHLLVQPSRGEAFGMAPLEACASGVPVAATLCTGHSEHMTAGTPGVVPIAHGPDAPIDDLPGSVAPTVSPDSVSEALGRAYNDWTELRQEGVSAAEHVRSLWSWRELLSQWIGGVKG